jgi:hypothetical protein
MLDPQIVLGSKVDNVKQSVGKRRCDLAPAADNKLNLCNLETEQVSLHYCQRKIYALVG